MSLRSALLAAALVGLGLLACPSVRGAETWTVAGRTFERVRVLEVTAATVTIAHSGGMVQLELAQLPGELQARFNFDPAAAAAWKNQAAAGMVQTEDIKRRHLAEQARRQELEAVQQRIADRNAAADPDYVEFRPEVDLRPVFVANNLYLKNQGRRPSCTIFAVVSAIEYAYARRLDLHDPLSEDYLIWAFQRTFPGKSIDDGYNFGEVLQVLGRAGVARRATLPESFAADPRPDAIPPEALADAATRREFTLYSIRPDDELVLSKIVRALNNEVPVIIGIRWPAPAAVERSNLLKDQKPQSGAAHAVMLVGYQSDGTPESLVFIYRNSYGPQWGLGGYGLMAGSYLQAHVLTAFSLLLPDFQ